MDRVALGKRIKEERKKLKYTQDNLSEMAEITVAYLGEIERGEKTPGLDVLVNIANALNASCDYLLRGDLISGSVYVDADISRKLSTLTHKERLAAEAILDAYIKSIR